MNVTGEVLEFFIYNCPSLEEMTVHGLGELVNLEVLGPSLKLKHLSILYCLEVKSLKICDRNLVTLVTSSSDKLLLLNVPMLIKVGINGRPTHILDEILPIVSCVLIQLEVLKINADDALVSEQTFEICIYLYFACTNGCALIFPRSIWGNTRFFNLTCSRNLS